MQAKTIICSMLIYIFDMRINWCISIAFDAFSSLGSRTTDNIWEVAPHVSPTRGSQSDIPSDHLSSSSSTLVPTSSSSSSFPSSASYPCPSSSDFSSPRNLPRSNSSFPSSSLLSTTPRKRSLWWSTKVKIETASSWRGVVRAALSAPPTEIFDLLYKQLFVLPALSPSSHEAGGAESNELSYTMEVLLELTRYEYAPLRALAFALIDRYMMEKASLLRRMMNTHIIVDPEVLRLYKQVAHDMNLLRSLQGWLGSDNEALRGEVRRRCCDLLLKFRDMCTLGLGVGQGGGGGGGGGRGGQTEAQVVKHQTILRTLEAHTCAVDILRTPFKRIPSSTAGRLDSIDDQDLHELIASAYKFLIMFCSGVVNEEIQITLHRYVVDTMLPHQSLEGIPMTLCWTAILKDNFELCSQLPPQTLVSFIRLILNCGKRPSWVKFLEAVVLVTGKPIQRNQVLVLDLLIEFEPQVSGLPKTEEHWQWRDTFMRQAWRPGGSFFGCPEPLQYHAAFVSLLASCCCGGNAANVVKVSGLVSLAEIMESLLWLAAETRASLAASNRKVAEEEEGPSSSRFQRPAGAREGQGTEEAGEAEGGAEGAGGGARKIDGGFVVGEDLEQEEAEEQSMEIEAEEMNAREEVGAEEQDGSEEVVMDDGGEEREQVAEMMLDEDEKEEEELSELSEEQVNVPFDRDELQFDSEPSEDGPSSDVMDMAAIHLVKTAYVRLLHQCYVSGQFDRATAEIRDPTNGFWPMPDEMTPNLFRRQPQGSRPLVNETRIWGGRRKRLGEDRQISLIEDLISEIELATTEEFHHSPPEGSAQHFVLSAALPLLIAYFKRHFTSRFQLPVPHTILLDQLAGAIWHLCGHLPSFQREVPLRCIAEMKTAGAILESEYDVSMLRQPLDRQMSRLRGSEIARKGHIFKKNWLNFCRLFSRKLEINDLQTMEGPGARNLALLLCQRSTVPNSNPPFFFSEIVQQLTSLLSGSQVLPELSPDQMVRLLRTCRAMIYLTPDWEQRQKHEESDENNLPAAAAGAGAGAEREEEGEGACARPEKIKGMDKWEMFEQSIPVRYSKANLDALMRVQSGFAQLGMAEMAVKLVSHSNQWVQAEAVRLAIALTDEGNSEVQGMMHSVLVEEPMFFQTLKAVLAAASSTVKFVRKGLDKVEMKERRDETERRERKEMRQEGASGRRIRLQSRILSMMRSFRERGSGSSRLSSEEGSSRLSSSRSTSSRSNEEQGTAEEASAFMSGERGGARGAEIRQEIGRVSRRLRGDESLTSARASGSRSYSRSLSQIVANATDSARLSERGEGTGMAGGSGMRGQVVDVGHEADKKLDEEEMMRGWEMDGEEGAKNAFKDSSLHKKAWVILSGHVTNVLRMLQLMCEGHNAQMQRLLRVQDEAAGSSDAGGGGGGVRGVGVEGGGINVLHEIISLLEHLQPSLDKNLGQKKPLLAEIALQALNTLQEAIQGPCFENQLALVRSNFLSITQRMVASLPYRNESTMTMGVESREGAAAAGGGGEPAEGTGVAEGDGPIRHHPDVIGSILNYTALGSRPAGSMDCPMLGANDLRCWLRNGVLSVYLSLLEEIGSNSEIPSKMAAVIDFTSLLPRCRQLQAIINDHHDASHLKSRENHRSLLNFAWAKSWARFFAAEEEEQEDMDGDYFQLPGSRRAANRHRELKHSLPMHKSFNSDCLLHLLPSEVLNSLIVIIKLDDFDRWLFGSAEAAQRSEWDETFVSRSRSSAAFKTCSYSVLKCEKPQRCGALCFEHALCVGNRDLDQFFARCTCAIEVVREGQLEKVYFPLTEECRRLSQDSQWTQAALAELHDVPRENPIQKVQHFMAAARVLVHKIQHYERIRQRYPWAQWVLAHLPHLKRGPFFTSLLIVAILVLFCGTSKSFTDLPAGATVLIRALGLVQMLLVVVGLVAFVLIESPLLVLYQKQSRERGQQEVAGDRLVRRPSNGGSSDSEPSDLLLLTDQRLDALAVQLEGVPKRLLLQNLDFWYSVLLVVASILGLLLSPFFFIVHLLDFIIYHPSGAIVLQSAKVGGPLLIRTGLVGILVIFMYAVVSFLSFAGDPSFSCSTLYECIGLHLVNAIASSSIGGLWAGWERVPQSAFEDVEGQFKTVFIVSFLIVWVFLLQNIFTGQIVDAFTSIRDEKAAKEKDLDDKCFVCSIDRFAFEQRLGGFVDHVRSEHNPLHYLFYIDYLLKRNPTEYTGLESFVRCHVDAMNYDWIPIGRARHTDRLQQFRAKQRDSQEGIGRLEAALSKMESRMMSVEGQIEGVRSEIAKSSSKGPRGGASLPRRTGGVQIGALMGSTNRPRNPSPWGSTHMRRKTPTSQDERVLFRGLSMS